MKSVSFLIFIAMIAVVAAYDPTDDPSWPAFQAFVQKYNKRYNSVSETRGKFSIFKDNLVLIEERNARGGAHHGINEFTDLHPNEFSAMYKGYRMTPATDARIAEDKRLAALPNATGVPLATLRATKSIDWRTKGGVTPVKNQGQCGSCWAFSATEEIESCNFLATGTLDKLSPQQIVSCDSGELGCNGGNTGGVGGAYDYVMNTAHGIEFDQDYTYKSGTSQETGTCKFKKADIAVDITGCKYVSQKAKDEDQMLTQVGTSPISICVDATIWQTYSSGVVTVSSDCGTQLDHCVQVAGYNAAGSPPYWLVRNSWGTSWGNAGYIWVEAGKNVCGIATDATVTSPGCFDPKTTKGYKDCSTYN